MNHTEVLIIGGGAAGMAAALAAEKKGYRKILIVERKDRLGGILLQCTHKGFGLGYFKEDLSGQEYSGRFCRMLEHSSVKTLFQTIALKLFPDRSALLSGPEGIQRVSFDILILATGCRERTLYSQEISGTRPSGILTCGTAQKLMNVDGLEIGDDIVILGTGDVGQIMARQFALSRKRILCMIEKEAQPGGLKRNHEQCLKAYDIPVRLNTEILKVHGNKRIEGITIKNTLTGETSYLECKTLLTAIGMIPETDLITASFGGDDCPSWLVRVGNCDYVHDIVDSVTSDALQLWDEKL